MSALTEEFTPGALADALVREAPSDPAALLEIGIAQALTISAAVWRQAARLGLGAPITEGHPVTFGEFAEALHGCWEWPFQRLAPPQRLTILTVSPVQRATIVEALRADEARRVVGMLGGGAV